MDSKPEDEKLAPRKQDKPSVQSEGERARKRRTQLDLHHTEGNAQGTRPWALCLSGGGIRSATFCLGVLQGLSRTPSPQALAAPDAAAATEPRSRLLAQFDFLSTVSGGGYIGAFFASLFVRGRLSGETREKEGEDDETAARRAYRALQDDPPQRMRTSTNYDPEAPGAAALAWLRDNGRYLTPTGGGDLLYATAIAIRNWFAVHFVVATALLFALSLSMTLRLAAALCPAFPALELSTGSNPIWSSSWWAVAVLLSLCVLPLGIAYWFAQPEPSAGKGLDDKPKAWPLALKYGGAIGGVACLIGAVAWRAVPPGTIGGIVLVVLGALSLLGCAYYLRACAKGPRPDSVIALRVRLSRGLTRSLALTLALVALALVESVALSLYEALRSGGLAARLGSAGGLTAGAVWLIRFVAGRLQADPTPRKRRAGVPLQALALIAAVALWALLAIALDVFLLWIYFDDTAIVRRGFAEPSAIVWIALAGTLIWLALAWVAGRFLGFVNLSTYQPMYSARLTRAYLGASNHARFAPGDENAAKLRNVTEPVKGDALETTDLHANPWAPIHYINVCLNQTAGPEGQLVQRDRKGKPLVLAPWGFYVDGRPFAGDATGGGADMSGTLSVGEWIGVSGAAVSTGLGRTTGLGTSLLLGFANVRLGRWWPHGIVPQGTGGQHIEPSWSRRAFPSQHYLFDELTAKFQGYRLPYAYLSDGGHFENTAAYEMLRPEREVQLLVVCDCGADPDYLFGDLSNLVRLARIDHQLELRVNTEAADDPKLARRFATPEAFRRDPDTGKLPAPSERCAVLLDVCRPAEPHAPLGTPATVVARVIVIKPTLLADLPSDLINYRQRNPVFPQETTGDQFFDEAQWESYRKLGLEIVRRLFPQGDDPAYAEAFWARVRVA